MDRKEIAKAADKWAAEKPGDRIHICVLAENRGHDASISFFLGGVSSVILGNAFFRMFKQIPRLAELCRLVLARYDEEMGQYGLGDMYFDTDGKIRRTPPRKPIPF